MPPRSGVELLRWAKFFSTFQFTLHLFLGKKNFADALSMLPQHESERETVMNSPGQFAESSSDLKLPQ